IVDETKVIAKAKQVSAIFRTEDLLEEDFEVVFVTFAEVLLAVAGIDDEAEGEWHVLAASEKGDFLQDAVFEAFDVVSGQCVDESAAAVAYGEANADHVDVDLDSVLAETGAGEEREE